jgi:hypothetical protein
MEYRLAPPLAGLCGPADPKTTKGVMLWYVFTVGRQSYMFAKFEGHSAVSVAHAWSAVSRYVLKRKKKTPFAVRRENAYKDKGGVTPERIAATVAQNIAQLWPQHASAARSYDKSIRVGMEMFVPAGVVAALLAQVGPAP